MNKTDKLFSASFFLGACTLAFVAGAALSFYRLPPAVWIEDALEGGKVWQATTLTPRIEQHADDLLPEKHVAWDKGKAFNGYTLMTLRGSTTAYLLDMNGNVVFTWSAPFENVWPDAQHIHRVDGKPAGRTEFRNVKLMPNGDLIAVYEGIGDTPFGYGLARIDRHGKTIWKFDDNTHHDFYIDPQNGTIYAIAQSMVSGGSLGLEGLARHVLTDSILTLSPEGKELDRLPVVDAFVNSPYRPLLTGQIATNGWDLLHTNSIVKLEPAMAAAFPLFKPGQLLISVRNLSTVAVVDPATHAVVWAYGGLWKHQHSAKFLPNGHIFLFDNEGYEVKGHTYSRAIEIDPVRLSVAWSYEGGPDNPFYSDQLGSVQRLPNGNSLILESLSFRIFEVTPDKNLAWEYTLPKARLNLPEQADQKKDSGRLCINSVTRYGADELPFLKELAAQADEGKAP